MSNKKSPKKSKKTREPKLVPMEVVPKRQLAKRIHDTINILTRFIGRPVSFEEICKGLCKTKSMTEDYSTLEIMDAMDEVHPKMWFTDIAWKPKGDKEK